MLSPADERTDSAKDKAEIKARLVPPQRWKRLVEPLIERLPRRQVSAELVPNPGLEKAGANRWEARVGQPMFAVELLDGPLPRGWIYIETMVQAFVGQRQVRLGMRRSDGHVDWLEIPTNRRGGVREVLMLEHGVDLLWWQPVAGPGLFAQFPFIAHRISPLEARLRMFESIASYRHLVPAGPKLALEQEYARVRAARVRHDRLVYPNAEIPAQQQRGHLRLTHRRPQPVASASVVFRLHGIDLQARATCDTVTLSSLQSQRPGGWRLAQQDDTGPAWNICLRPGDRLAQDALATLAEAIHAFPEARLIYTDHDYIAEDGLQSPVCKPDWDLDLFLHHNYLGPLVAVHPDLPGPAGSSRSSYLLSAALTAADQGGARIVHLPIVLAHRPLHECGDHLGAEPWPACDQAPMLAARACTLEQSEQGFSTVLHPLPGSGMKVSVLIPTRDGGEVLKKCISTLLRTRFDHYEVIVIDNGSEDPETLRLLAELGMRADFTIIRDPRPFNYSQLNNRAAQAAAGDFLIFLNDDVEIVDPDWMQYLIRQAAREEIGAVGAKLLYPDRRVQHAGVALGIGGVAGHVHRFLEENDPGYCGRACIPHSFSAVTGAAFALRKRSFLQVGGFDERLAVSYNDIDLCLRLRAIGKVNLLEPRARLIHYESWSRGTIDTSKKSAQHTREMKMMRSRWRDIIDDDPAYNPNLTRRREDFGFAEPLKRPA